jgi:hypothetical protein
MHASIANGRSKVKCRIAIGAWLAANHRLDTALQCWVVVQIICGNST